MRADMQGGSHVDVRVLGFPTALQQARRYLLGRA